MRRSKRSNHPVARRVALASMTVLAASGIGLVAAPMAFGQIVIPIGNFGNSSQGASVTNSGSASSNSGGNTAVGNASTNNASVNTDGGGLLDVPVTLGAPTNTSTGEAAVTTGPATAVGNQAGTSVGQSTASGNQVNSFLNSQRQAQFADVTNAGSASANSGGNTGIGNASQNAATVNQTGGGLLGVGVGVGGPTNTSTGAATINSGAANAAGNNSSTELGQVSSLGGAGSATRAGVGAIAGIGGAGIGTGPCSTGRFASFQEVDVRNQGQAEANTGNNVAIGNASTNNAEANAQTVSGGLLGVGIQIGGPVNNSSGTAVINTGPATAVGNNSSTQVGQVQGCQQQVVTLAAGGRPGVIVPPGHIVQKVGTATLARTGLDTGDLGMIAGALLGGGMLLIASQRRRAAARALAVAVPMAGFGLGLGADEWDRVK